MPQRKRKIECKEKNYVESGGRNRDIPSITGVQKKTKRRDVETNQKEKKTYKIPQKVGGRQLRRRGLDLKEVESLKMKIRGITEETHAQKEQIFAQQSLITQLVKEKAVFERNINREECLQKLLQLGLMNKNRIIENRWSSGFAFDDLQRRRAEINVERAALHERKIQLFNSQISIMTNSTDALTSKTVALENNCLGRKQLPSTVQEIHEYKEILDLQQNQLKRVDTSLKLQKQHLERECIAQSHERVRVFREDNFQFDEHSLLNGRYILLNFLCKGGYGEVFEAFDQIEKTRVACKIHLPPSEWSLARKTSFIENAIRECDMQKNFNHPHIVQMCDGFYFADKLYCTVMEFCQGSNLDLYLRIRRSLPEKEGKSFIMQIVSALKYLNEQNPSIIHFDLKPGNIMLTDTSGACEVKLTDFGLSKCFNPADGYQLSNNAAGTLWYLSPECCFETPQIVSSKVDVWSVGVTYYKMLYGIKPFSEYRTWSNFLKENIPNAAEIEFPNKPKVSIEAKNFLRDCLAFRQEERIDVMAMAKHSYLQPPPPKPRRGQSLAQQDQQKQSTTLCCKGPPNSAMQDAKLVAGTLSYLNQLDSSVAYISV